jgi:hypothetical protein
MGREHKYMGHETANWWVRGLGYTLFNADLCNQPYYWEVVVGPGAQLCTLLEVWVLRVGISTLGRKHQRLCTSRIGDSQRFQIVMFRPIRLHHTNCLQVDIKTHSFIKRDLKIKPTSECRCDERLKTKI